MFYNININDIYDSSDLLFSIPVHEKQDIINNQIENILNYNPNSNLIFHINKSFKNFNALLSSYKNVYINSNSFNYKYARGLLWIHINNFLEAIRLNISFKYFIIISSNEMFIKYGLNKYINEYKNGLQIVKYNSSLKWHNFQKNIEKTTEMQYLLKNINLDTFYGGQTEGQFYEKSVFQRISDIYIKYYGSKELNNFETEEIVAQTIFKSFNLNYGLPFTLQNYSNNLIFNDFFIEQLREDNVLIPNNSINDTLLESPHINQNCKSIFSIKRVDRTFNNVRYYLSNKGFILNKSIYQLNTHYYSNGSSLYLHNNNHLQFIKSNEKKEFNWVGIEIDIGYYYLNFEIKSNKIINNFNNIGLKINDNIIYDFFLKNLILDEWVSVSLPIHINVKQILMFNFDNCNEDINIEIKNIEINVLNKKNNNKDNIIICLYEKIFNNNIDYTINYNNIYNKIIKPFENIYNIYIFISLFQPNYIINYYKPYSINIINKNSSINDIFIQNNESIIEFNEKIHIDIKFIIYFDIESIFKKNIIDFNFYVNKFNIISYYIPYINNTISNSYEFMSVPFKYIYIFYKLIYNNRLNNNICYLLYSYLKDVIGQNNFNFIYDDNYAKNTRTPLIKYLSEVNNINTNNGYLLNNKYLYDIIYYNKYSKILKINNNEFYFYKKPTYKSTPFQWIGLEYVDNNTTKNNTILKVAFEIKLLKNINIYDNINYGLKVHDPLLFFNDWIKKCELNNYIKIEIDITIFNKKQYIILNFDDYLDEIEFFIKDFKIIIDYN